MNRNLVLGMRRYGVGDTAAKKHTSGDGPGGTAHAARWGEQDANQLATTSVVVDVSL